jgi:hypothetical protein
MGRGEWGQVDARVPLEGVGDLGGDAQSREDSPAEVIVHAEDGTVEEERTV